MQTRITRISPEVFYSDGHFLAVDGKIVSMLKEAAATSERRRARLCFHPDPQAAQQEMLIVMNRSSYVRPHRHLNRVETLGVIEGTADALLFDETGRLTSALPMSAPAAGGAFFYRMPPGIFHTLLFKSEWLVFVETTIGPFDPSTSEGAPWAPPEELSEAGHAFLARCAADFPGPDIG